MADRKTALADQLARLTGPAEKAEVPVQPRLRPMPAEQDSPEAYPGRIPLKVPVDMKRDLEQAKVDDHIEVSARIRAMIALWQQGGKFRAEVDKMARGTGRPSQKRT